MKRTSISRDLQSKIWEKWESLYLVENDEHLKTMTFWSLVNEVATKDTEDWIKDLALGRFLFELKYVIREPVYTMKWLYGEHVNLFDVYGCKKHKWICTTHDDDCYIPNLTVFCPDCNKDIVQESKIKDYKTMVEGKYLTDDEWQKTIDYSKIVKKYNRKENTKYWIKKWQEKGYLKYRISKLLGINN